MQSCSLFLLVAVAVACCAMASREAEMETHDVTAWKCCNLTGKLFFLAPDQLGKAVAPVGDVTTLTLPEPPSEGVFYGHQCVQGSESSISMSYDCITKNYVFDGFVIKPTRAGTLTAEYCKNTVMGQELPRCNSATSWEARVEASKTDRAEKLRCPKEDGSKRMSSDCHKKTKVAIFADYDGCWDIISATSKEADPTKFESEDFPKTYDYVSGVLMEKIEEITDDRHVILFVGSNRQSYEDDSHNADMNNNGRALGATNAFERWPQETWNGYGDCWELNRALLSDKHQPCSSWDEERNSPWHGMSSQQAKVKLLENGIKQLLLEDHVNLYFFDDDAELLAYVRANAWIPPNMRLHTIHYNWHDYATGTTEDPLKVIEAK